MRKRHGFTIVELLIVIVIIAILAAISIAVYSGMQTRAKNTTRANVVTSYVKALKLYEAENGVMPEDGSASDVYRCIGENYPSGCGTISGPTGCGLGTITNAASSTFNALLRPYMSNTNEVPRLNETGLSCSTGGLVAGAMYVYRGSTTKRSEIYYLIEGGSSACSMPGGTTLAVQASQGANTLCRIYLN